MQLGRVQAPPGQLEQAEVVKCTRLPDRVTLDTEAGERRHVVPVGLVVPAQDVERHTTPHQRPRIGSRPHGVVELLEPGSRLTGENQRDPQRGADVREQALVAGSPRRGQRSAELVDRLLRLTPVSQCDAQRLARPRQLTRVGRGGDDTPGGSLRAIRIFQGESHQVVDHHFVHRSNAFTGLEVGH